MSVYFDQVYESRLYQLKSLSPTAWRGYMLLPRVNNPNAPISLADAINYYRGCFLFAPQAPNFDNSDQADEFIDAVLKWIDDSGRVIEPHFVWLPRAGTSPVFGAPNFSRGGNFAFKFSHPASGSCAITTNFKSVVGNDFSLSLSTGIRIDADDDGFKFLASAPNSISIQAPPALQFMFSDQLATIPLTGPSAGCIVVPATMRVIPPSSGGKGMLVGFQYAHTRSTSPGSVLSTEPVTVIQPFQGLDTTNLLAFKVVAAVDPLDPLCAGVASNAQAGLYRTIIAAQPETPALPSFFRTVNNAPVSLTPRSAADSALGPSAYDGGFIFQPVAPLKIGENLLPVQGDVYLAPAGDFLISVADSEDIILMPGLAGLENLALKAAGTLSPDALRFVGLCPAYSPEFPLPVSDIADPSSGTPLPPIPATPLTYVTSWAQVIPGAESIPTYSAQPEGNALYGPGGAFAGDSKVVVGSLRPTNAIGPVSFPIAPWAGALGGGIPVADWAAYESKVLSATRRNVLQDYARRVVHASKAARPANLADTLIQPNGTTPQGLLAQLSQDGGQTLYDGVILAQSNPDSQMAFRDLNAKLQSLFQTNQLFAVITNGNYLGKFDNSVDIAGWKMRANVGGASASSNVSNVLIMKFCEGALVDLVQQPSAWTDTEDFSNPQPGIGVGLLSHALKQYFDIAIAAAEGGDTLYSNFKSIIQNPEWQGVLVLAAEILATDLPEQLRGLASGINFTNLRAHHFGVSVSPVRYDGQTLKIPTSSSLFGLVDYQLPAFAQNLAGGASPTQPISLPASGIYNFTVLQLQSLFENGTLVDFRSHVQVTANVLFGSNVLATYFNATGQVANSVVLTGFYQNQGDQGGYLFESDHPTVFATDSNVLRSVLVKKVMFNTLTSNDGREPPSILSRILIWGAFNFAIMTNEKSDAFDMMSYGMGAEADPSAATGGLAFSNLHIDMSSPVATPNIASYTLVENNLAFDLPNSVLREGSLVSGLALQPQAFLVASAGATPAQHGYLPVQLDEGAPPRAAVTQPWYGLSCLINMGGPGALASAAGFNSTILLGWSPQSLQTDASYVAFAGLQLPGAAPGASAFSLQGVINLKVDAISLSLAPVQGADRRAFVLRLSDVSLSFLGIKKLPSGSSIDLFIFGSPDGGSSLGWYGAYVEDKAKPSTRSAEVK